MAAPRRQPKLPARHGTRRTEERLPLGQGCAQAVAKTVTTPADDGEPSEEKMKRAEVAKLDAAIAGDVKELAYDT